MKKCSKCKVEKDKSEFFKATARYDGLGHYCKNCQRGCLRKTRLNNPTYFKEKDRKYYEKNREKILSRRKVWSVKNKHKSKAHEKVKNALYKGLLKKDVCRDCGSENTIAHHEDYSKPLDVIWLCQKHHMILHHGKYEESV